MTTTGRATELVAVAIFGGFAAAMIGAVIGVAQGVADLPPNNEGMAHPYALGGVVLLALSYAVVGWFVGVVVFAPVGSWRLPGPDGGRWRGALLTLLGALAGAAAGFLALLAIFASDHLPGGILGTILLWTIILAVPVSLAAPLLGGVLGHRTATRRAAATVTPDP